MMYKVFLKYPDALRPAFPRLKDKLEDPDAGEIIIITNLLHFSHLSLNLCVCVCVCIFFFLFSGVQSAAVNVVCELARKNPKNYLSLAPVFFKLMTTSTNNWMLIKIIKLVSILTFNILSFNRT